MQTSNNHLNANGVYGVLTAGNCKPILFSTPMVQAILDGRKSKTRRIVKQQPSIDKDSGYKYWDNLMFDIHDDVLETMYMPEHAPFKIGDILWVRETWAKELAIFNDTRVKYLYRADEHVSDSEIKWKPSIFMPKEACRIFLRLKNIKVERLREISENDIISEGVKWEHPFANPNDCSDKTRENHWFGLWQELWIKINGRDSWNKNPFVWVYEFERTDAPFACR